MLCVSVLQRGQYDEVCMFTSTLYKYDLRNCLSIYSGLGQDAKSMSW